MEVFRTDMRMAYIGRINANENSAEKIAMGIRKDIHRLKRQCEKTREDIMKAAQEIEERHKRQRSNHPKDGQWMIPLTLFTMSQWVVCAKAEKPTVSSEAEAILLAAIVVYLSRTLWVAVAILITPVHALTVVEIAARTLPELTGDAAFGWAVALLAATGMLVTAVRTWQNQGRNNSANTPLGISEADEARRLVRELEARLTIAQSALEQRTSQLTKEVDQHDKTIKQHNEMVRGVKGAQADFEKMQEDLEKAKALLEKAKAEQSSAEQSVKQIAAQLVEATASIERLTEVAKKSNDQKAQQLALQEEEIMKLQVQLREKSNTIALQVAEQAFKLSTETLTVIKSMLERPTRSGGQKKPVGSPPEKFDGTDLRKFKYWYRGTRSYIGGQFKNFEDYRDIRLQVQMLFKGRAQECFITLGPEMFSQDDQTEDAKSKYFNDTMEFLKARYENRVQV